ncbi:hypothetical protein D3C72_1823170 [compost metagenome]
MARSFTSGRRSKSKLPPETTAMTVLPSSLSRPSFSSAAMESAPAGSSTTPSRFSISMIVTQMAFSGMSMTCSAGKSFSALKFRSPMRATAAPSTKLSTLFSVTGSPRSRLFFRLGAPSGSQNTKFSLRTVPARKPVRPAERPPPPTGMTTMSGFVPSGSWSMISAATVA